MGRTGRCDERGFLEFHHRKAFATGGATTVDNLERRCRAHNAYEAELFFGPFLAREERASYAAGANSVRTEFSGTGRLVSTRRGGGTGRRSGLKIPWPSGRVGSIPAPGTSFS